MWGGGGGGAFHILLILQNCVLNINFNVGFTVNRQRPTSVMRRPDLKIPTLAEWLISPSVRVIIKICKKHRVLKTNSKINIYNAT